jgi:hypothetical protein
MSFTVAHVSQKPNQYLEESVDYRRNLENRDVMVWGCWVERLEQFKNWGACMEQGGEG